MNIQYYGHSCFKITTKPAGRATEDIVFFIDPFDKVTGLRLPQGAADAVFVTHHHHDHDNTAAIKGNFVLIDAPGEYSVKGINVIGMETFHDDQDGTLRGKNTVFIFETEDMKLCHLGDLGSIPSPNQMEMLEKIDILFIPVGGKYTLDGKKAAELVRQVEPVMVIPMHYKIKDLTLDIADEKIFCAEMGNCRSQGASKLTIKKKDLEGKRMEAVLMDVEK